VTTVAPFDQRYQNTGPFAGPLFLLDVGCRTFWKLTTAIQLCIGKGIARPGLNDPQALDFQHLLHAAANLPGGIQEGIRPSCRPLIPPRYALIVI